MIEAIAFQDGDYWVIDIPAISGVTQALSRDEIEPMALDYYECETDQKADPINFKFTILEGQAAKEYEQLIEKRYDGIDLTPAPLEETNAETVS
jgi:hypothetical protein